MSSQAKKDVRLNERIAAEINRRLGLMDKSYGRVPALSIGISGVIVEKMQVKDQAITQLIARIGDHYRTNLSNRYVRPALLYLPLDNQTWDLIEKLTEQSEEYAYQGIHLDDLYRRLAAAARFTALARRELAPNIRQRLGGGQGPDKVLRDMAVNNFSSNLKVFADLLNELYVKLVALDKEASAESVPLYLQMSELQDIGRLLVG
jgi:hypothetical protein